MNLGEVKDRALMLMREWSTDGVKIPDGDNADYLNSMYAFADIAQKQIAKRRRIRASYDITQTAEDTETVEMNKYDLPDDFYQLDKIIYTNEDGVYAQVTSFNWEGKKTLVIPNDITGTFHVHYFRLPTTITSTTDDSYEFEVDEDVQSAIPFFIAAQCMMDEDIGRATLKLNEYHAMLAEIDELPDNNVTQIHNVTGW
jgi:hypothetical protein